MLRKIVAAVAAARTRSPAVSRVRELSSALSRPLCVACDVNSAPLAFLCRKVCPGDHDPNGFR